MSSYHPSESSNIEYETNRNTTLYQSAREKHIKRYLDPWINIHYTRGDNTPHISELDLRRLGKPHSTFIPRVSPDANLTALAQLGALRLNARRAIISLVGTEDQYVLAEATQTISLQSDTAYTAADDLWLGHCVIPCSLTFYGQAIAEWRAAHTARRAEQRSDTAAGIHHNRVSPQLHPAVVNNIPQDARFKSLPDYCKPPNAQFYAAIPMFAGSGHILGVYEIYDDDSREGLDPQHLQYLQNVATLVSKHLVATSAGVMQTRGERLVKGLALFMEGKSSLRQWFVEEGYKQRLDFDESGSGNDEEISDEATERYGPQHTEGRSGSHASRKHSAAPAASADSTKAVHSEKSVIRNQEHRRLGSQADSHLSAAPKSVTASKYKASESHEAAIATVDSTGNDNDDLITREMRSLFSRASNLIREACGVDGVMVYDAGVIHDEESAISSHDSQQRLTADDEIAGLSSDGSESDSHSATRFEDYTEGDGCNILGFSVTAKSSLAGNTASRHHRLLRRKSLSRLIKRYPRGKTFHFNKGDSLSSSEETDLKFKALRQHRITLREQKSINDVIGGVASSAAFFPLWDWHRNRWFAGIFAWTTSSSRLLGASDDLPYLKAFGNSIMTELARMDAATSDRAKAKFISSISHELRSPLHGILAGTELLLSNEPDGLEGNLISTIENCGKTLLDTVDHLLEYSKINSTRSSIVHRTAKVGQPARAHDNSIEKTRQHPDISNATANLQLATEELVQVLETLLLGFTSNPVGSHIHFSENRDEGLNLRDYQRFPYIVFNIDYTKEWSFKLPAGAWRRVIMNLVGNSLKFTKTGYVRVDLRCTELEDQNKTNTQCLITLDIEDTGKGISEEFLRHQLYTPFLQEDILSPGTGLGLHLTRQIVQDLRGKLTVNSIVGQGSKFTVELPLYPSTSKDNDVENRSNGRFSMRSKMRDRVAAIVSSCPSNVQGARAKGMSLVTDSLVLLFRDWFCMKIKRVESMEDAAADLIIMTDDHFQDLVDSHELSQFIAHGTNDNVVRRLMVLCYNLHFANRVSSKYENIQFVTPPFGTQSIAKALSRHFSETLAEGRANEPDDENADKRLEKHPHNKESVTSEVPDRTRSSESPKRDTPPDNVQSPVSEPSRAKEFPKAVARLLLVEDNEINMKFLVTFAKRNKFRYWCAQNGAEAVEAYKSSGDDQFDVIVMDISMPVMDGLSATREIRRFERERGAIQSAGGADVRAHIVALTGVASENAQQDAFVAGVDLFLTKPTPLKRLLSIVEDVIRSRDENAS